MRQIASIAATFCGWCSSVLRPCWSPTNICSGTSTAATVSATRSTSGVDTFPAPRRSCHALTPASRKLTVMAEASSMCVRRYGNDGFDRISSQLVTWKTPSRISNPTGVCIHESRHRIQKALMVVPNATQQ